MHGFLSMRALSWICIRTCAVHIPRPSIQLGIHLLLVAVALALLPVAPSEAWKPVADEAPTWRILCLLAASVGIPYFVLATTGPLVQSWFFRAFAGQSPYRLYALSNIGSLAALFSYPFLFEPAFDVTEQGRLWTVGFIVFAVLCTAGATAAALLNKVSVSGTVERCEQLAVAPKAFDLARWLLLPAFASMMLLATTNHVCQNIAVIPFLWVLPLSLYLLSFIIAFDAERWYWRRTYAVSAILLLLASAGIEQLTGNQVVVNISFIWEIVLYFAALFTTCMVCHGELARHKPHPRWLTSYYLMIAGGGAIGGLFVSLIAPVIFNTFFEWKLSLIGGCLLAAVVLLHAQGPIAPTQYRRMVAAAGMLLLAFVGLNCVPGVKSTGRPSVVNISTRSFYGTAEVLERFVEDPLAHQFQLLSGRIIHGLQFKTPQKRNLPTAYYGQPSGVGRLLELKNKKPNLRVGAIGLGAGTIAEYCQPDHYYTFYEINPEMKVLAEKHFTFLEDCRGRHEVILGDGRISLERQPPQQFDVLVIDAFSGDAIPAHLLTREAMDIYLKHLKPSGELAFNISNRYLNLVPVVQKLAEHAGLTALHITSEGNPAMGQFLAEWMILSRDPTTISALEPLAQKIAPVSPHFKCWTDNHSNLFEILK